MAAQMRKLMSRNINKPLNRKRRKHWLAKAGDLNALGDSNKSNRNGTNIPAPNCMQLATIT